MHANYKAGFTNGSGANVLRGLDPLDVHRYAVDRNFSTAFFEATLALPFLGYRRTVAR